MTQYFAYKGFRLSRADFPTRVLITSFLLMMVLALGLGVLNYRLRTGLTPEGTRQWYRGNEGAGENVDRLLFAKSTTELMDVTHPHLFEESFLFFILCHLFALTRVRSRLKTTIYILSFTSVLVDCAGPWLIRFVSPALAPLQVASPIFMSALVLSLVLVPLKEMWWDEPASSPREDRASNGGATLETLRE
ncbi:MAG: hypothetical protein ACE5HV_09630 [Acidobacteriota bacterium]